MADHVVLHVISVTGDDGVRQLINSQRLIVIAPSCLLRMRMEKGFPEIQVAPPEGKMKGETMKR